MRPKSGGAHKTGLKFGNQVTTQNWLEGCDISLKNGQNIKLRPSIDDKKNIARNQLHSILSLIKPHRNISAEKNDKTKVKT